METMLFIKRVMMEVDIRHPITKWVDNKDLLEMFNIDPIILELDNMVTQVLDMVRGLVMEAVLITLMPFSTDNQLEVNMVILFLFL